MTRPSRYEPPSVEQLHEWLTVDPVAGVLRWKPRPEVGSSWRAITGRAAWNRVYAGKPAGARTNTGYLLVKFTCGSWGRSVVAHRVLWAMVHGQWPTKELDHINQDRTDNRLCNLREASRQQNTYNSGARRGSSSGLKGVSFHKVTGMWAARVRLGGKERWLGVYETPEMAHTAYIAAAREPHGEFFCLERSPVATRLEELAS